MMNMDHKSELNRLYDFLSKYYLDTSMLSIPHKYRDIISKDSFEVGAVAFLSALYDFQMRVGLIRSRFLLMIDYLMKNELGIFELLDDKYLNDMLDKLLAEMKFFHRFDRKANLFKILLRIYYDTDWSSFLSSIDKDVDVAIAEYVWSKSVSLAPSRDIVELFNRFLSRRRNSPHKRINLFLRWTVRDEYPDLGLWSKLIDKRGLLIPLGTEIARTASRVFLGRVKELPKNRKSVFLITSILRKINLEDPIKYDFVLSRPVILGLCNKDIYESYCWVCPLKNVCRVASQLDLEAQRRRFEERLKIQDKEKRRKHSHNIVLRKGTRFIYEKYAKPLHLICSSDRSINHGLRPDLICDHNSPFILVAEAKTSTKSKEAPIQLKTYIEELRKKEYIDRKYFTFLIFGKHDSIELNHIIESLHLTNITRIADHVEVVIVEKEPPITFIIKS